MRQQLRRRASAAAPLLTAALLAAGALLAACGGVHPAATPAASDATASASAPGNTISGMVAIVPPGDSSGAANDAFAIDVAIAQVVTAMQTHDAPALRDLAGAELAPGLSDADYQRLAACVPEGATLQIESRETSIDGDAATVTVDLAVTSGGQTSTVQRTWTFHHETDGAWKLAALPACP